MLRGLSVYAGPHMRGATVRRLAIPATVKTATDTSAVNFPAPSHVSIAGEAASLARQLRNFYASPESSVTLSETARAELVDELVKLGQSIPDSSLSAEWIRNMAKIPETIRLGDNPVFKVLESERLAKK